VNQSELKPNNTEAHIFGNVGPKPIKQIIYPLRCMPNIQGVNSTDGFILSDTCTLMVVIEGAAGQGKIKYTLSLEDDLDHHVINLNHYANIKLEEGQSKNFTLNYNHPKLRSPTLEFLVEAKYGSVDVCVRVSKDGNVQGKPCDRQETIDASVPGMDDSFRRIFFHSDGDLEKIKGVYHIEFIGKQHSGIVFGSTEIEEMDKSQSFLSREIKAGLPVTESLRTWNSTMYYSFQLNPNLNIETVLVSLLPVKGEFTFAVRNDDIPPTLDQGFWVTKEDSLLLTSSDPQFKYDGVYTVAVFANKESKYALFSGWGDSTIASKTSEDLLNYRFQLKWSYTDKHNHLMPGVPDYGTLIQDNQCFVFEINKNWKEVLVVKNSPGHTSNLFASVSKPHKSPSADSHDYKAIGHETGFLMTESDIQTYCAESFRNRMHCNVYLCIQGRKHDEYMLAFTFDNHPFLLKDSKIFSGPIIKSDKKLHFIYYPSKDSPVDIEEFSGAFGASISASLIESDNKAPITFAKEVVPPFSIHSSLIHFTRDQITALKSPLVTVTVEKSIHQKTSSEVDYDFSTPFNLEVGFHVKELSKGISRINHIAKGQIAYFYFYNNDPSQDIVIGLDSLDGGDGRMYLSRGKETRPTERNCDKASYGFKSTYLIYNKKDSQGHGHKSLRGFYIVAVVAFTDIKFSINWRHRSDQVDYAFVNYKKKAIIQPGRDQYVSLANPMGEDIELHIFSHHKSLDVYYLRLDANRSFSANDLELFPSQSNHKIHAVVSPKFGAATVTIPKAVECAGCKYLFTFSNKNSSSAVEVDYTFVLSGDANSLYPQHIHAGEVVIDYFAKTDDTRRYICESIYKESSVMPKYLEVQVVTGSCEAKVSEDNTFADDKLKLIKSFGIGYHFVALDSSANEKIKNVNRARGVMVDRLYIQLVCAAKSQLKFVVVEQEKNILLKPNTVTENYMDEIQNGGDSYVYVSSGREKTVTLNFMIDHFMEEKSVPVNSTILKKVVAVYFAKDQKQLDHINSTEVKPIYSLYDPLNRKVLLEFKPRKGIFLINIKALPSLPYKYSFSLATEHVSFLPFGKYTVDYIGPNNLEKIFELKSVNIGNVYFKLNQCFGRPQSFSSPSANITDKRSVPLDLTDNDRFVNILTQEQTGESHYVQIIKSASPDASNEFGFLDHSKNATVFGVEAIEKEGFQSIPISDIRPINDDLWLDLNSDPVVYFRPLNNFNTMELYHSVTYHAVVSRDPEIVKYYTNCEQAYLHKVLKEGYKVSDVLQVFSTETNPTPEVDKITGLHFHKIKMELASGNRYYLNIFAKVVLKRPHQAVNFATISTLKVEYRNIEFEYSSFLYPLEWLAATFGLVAVMLGTCWVVKNKLTKHMLKLTGFKPVASSEIDDELEDYYLKVRSHFEDAEKSRSVISADQSVLASTTVAQTQKPSKPAPVETIPKLKPETELRELPKEDKADDEVKVPEPETAAKETEEDLFDGELEEAVEQPDNDTQDI
jgi:hypothetical protein